MATTILKASTIITMDEANPRAEAVAFDDATGKILAVGTVAQCQAAARHCRHRSRFDGAYARLHRGT